MKNPVLFFLISFLALLNVADYITAHFILPGESNIIYLLTGSLIPLLILKILLISGLYYYWYRNIYPNNFTLYLLIVIIVYSILLFILAVASNVVGILNPAIVEQSAQLTTAQKSQGFYSFITLIYIIPVGLTLLCFWLYELINKKAIIDKEFYKKRKWWQA
jgi:hypothetical protein